MVALRGRRRGRSQPVRRRRQGRIRGVGRPRVFRKRKAGRIQGSPLGRGHRRLLPTPSTWRLRARRSTMFCPSRAAEARFPFTATVARDASRGIFCCEPSRQCLSFADSAESPSGFNSEDHNPPHFHATYGGAEVTVDIHNPTVRGHVPKCVGGMIRLWALIHREEPLVAWEARPQRRIPRTDRPSAVAKERAAMRIRSLNPFRLLYFLSGG